MKSFIIFILLLIVISQENEPNVDLPEEYKAISTDKNKPDTLTCYQENGKFYFQFK